MPEYIVNKRVAENYDYADRAMSDEKLLEQTAVFLSELAEDRRALEFAIGTGRVALALHNHGVEVNGLVLSLIVDFPNFNIGPTCPSSVSNKYSCF